MKVKDIIKSALVLIGREDVARSIEKEEESETAYSLTAEEKETVETLLYCFNSVEDELARCYFPLKAEEALTSEDGVYAFSGFTERPLKIISVTAKGEKIKFEADVRFLKTDAKEITVLYRYAPPKKSLDGESAFGGEVSERLVAAGTASEYCLICGEAAKAQAWESVYRGEIDRLRRKSINRTSFPPRRWV
ncbi:MAG: hypothetical protein HFE40_06870 [Clostridia bacterium]|nr:hypothetical protein [Clostridia bacterium]